MADRSSPAGPKWLSSLASAVGKVTATVGAAAASAGELLQDRELRRKAAEVLLGQATAKLQQVQQGLARSAENLGQRLQHNRRQLQVVLARIEEQIAAYQQQRRQSARSQAELVDVQLGRKLFVDVPPELRSRMWLAFLVLDPSVVAALGPIQHQTGARHSPEQRPIALSATGLLEQIIDERYTWGTGTPPQLPAADSAPPPKESDPAPQSQPGEGAEEWEIVPDRPETPASTGAAAAGAEGNKTVQLILQELHSCGSGGGPNAAGGGSASASSGSSSLEPEVAARQAVLQCMLAVGSGGSGDGSGVGTGVSPAAAMSSGSSSLPHQHQGAFPQAGWYAPDSRYATLIEMTAGQEEVDDIISRDVNRTFPESAAFASADAQGALFRVLKAYSLHDLETGYCQGMAFAAGVLLMYVPEEPAFRLYCRLMDCDGPNLRRLYLPGLTALKLELARFEMLLSWRMPELAAHLASHSLPAVLYVSQWLMTVYAIALPPAFSARLIDVMLQDGNDLILQRVALAIMAALEEQLLALHDFEALITALKVEPIKWDAERLRSLLDSAIASHITAEELAFAAEVVLAQRNTSTSTSSALADEQRQQSQQHHSESQQHDASPHQRQPVSQADAEAELDALLQQGSVSAALLSLDERLLQPSSSADLLLDPLGSLNLLQQQQQQAQQQAQQQGQLQGQHQQHGLISACQRQPHTQQQLSQVQQADVPHASSSGHGSPAAVGAAAALTAPPSPLPALVGEGSTGTCATSGTTGTTLAPAQAAAASASYTSPNPAAASMTSPTAANAADADVAASAPPLPLKSNNMTDNLFPELEDPEYAALLAELQLGASTLDGSEVPLPDLDSLNL